MKKILVLNGSPKRSASFTMVVTNAFVKGMESVGDCETENINISDLNIKPCRGCLSCWGRTAGECVIRDDDLPVIKEKLKAADAVVESYPLFFFGMPGTVKVLIDRLLGMLETYRGEMHENDDLAHRLRFYKEGQSLAVITSCGFSESSAVFEPLKSQHDLILGSGNYTMITCPELKALIDTGKDHRLPAYLAKVEAAGAEFMRRGTLDEETVADLSKPPFSPKTYRILTENFWKEQEGSDTDDKSSR